MTARRMEWIAVAVIAALALSLRLIGLQYGLPHVYNPDEVAIMSRALSFATGTLNPHNFLYPTLYFYVLFGWVGLYLAFVWLSGAAASIAELRSLYFIDPTGVYTAGRALGAVCGTLAVVVTFRLAQRLFDARVAALAALSLAVAPLAVRDSHYVKHDVPATLAVVAAYLAIVRVWPCGRPGGRSRFDVIVAGAACGVAFSTHYYCLFVALPLFWAIVQQYRPAGWDVVTRRTAIAAAASAVTFFALSPFLAVEPMIAWRDITENRRIVIDRAVESGAFAPAMRYLEMLWYDSAGWPIVLAAAGGAVWMAAKLPARAVLLLAFPVAFFAFISNTFPASRYLNAVLPFVSVFAAWAAVSAARRVRAPAVIYVPIFVALLSPAIVTSVRTGLFFREDDTRTLAETWIAENVQPGATILTQPHSVDLRPTREGLIEALTRNLGSVEAASTKFQLQLALEPYPQPAYRIVYLGRGGLDAEKIYVDPAAVTGPDGLASLRALGVAYVVLKRYNGSDPEAHAFLTGLAREGRMVAAFSPYRQGVSAAEAARIEPFLHNTDARIDRALERPGPSLEIWQLHGTGP